MRFLFLFAGFTAVAHDLYLMPASFTAQPGKPVLVSIHNGDSFPASEGPTDPSRVLGGQLADLRIAGKATHGFADPAPVLAVSTQPRTIQIEATKFESYLKEEGLEQAIEYRRLHGESAKPGRETYSKHAKTVLTVPGSESGWAHAAGLDLEFVPEADPSTSRSLPVRVLYQGRPAPGLQVEAAQESGRRMVVGRTDSGGRIVVPIDARGRWRLHTVRMERASSSGAEWRSHWASLTFESR